VRLVAERDRFPDAQLRDGDNNTKNFEIVIADKLDRRMWENQKRWAEMYKRKECLPVDSPDERRAYALEAIPRICEKKVKRYLGAKTDKKVSVNLLIYMTQVQAPTVLYPVITVDEMVTLTEPYKNKFESIWLLCGNEDVRVWPKPKILGTPQGQDPFDCLWFAT